MGVMTGVTKIKTPFVYDLNLKLYTADPETTETKEPLPDEGKGPAEETPARSSAAKEKQTI
jgi:hypothetical protein